MVAVDYVMSMPPVPAAVTAARLLARDVVSQVVGPEQAAAAELAVSEMVTATLARTRGGPGRAPVRVAIHIEGDGDLVQIEVGAGGGEPDARSAETAGYGVQVLTATVDDIEAITDETGATILRIAVTRDI
jgi:hypothetical protein